ncbi:MAG: tRNA (N6-threonylcarbamoyladenosine(37)-N6)-methyltransferase TrmO [Firmicutes bacterium]|nr:tRNA (N6-threonylcarbamoyladenosine(37)-N6)-methyltransferase TrmO [Bacillota bacterium]
MVIEKIATVYTGFAGKFGLPRQSGVVEGITGRIVMEKDFCGEDFFRGISSWSHIWLIWGFSRNTDAGWTATVRPPRLGGNRRVGVFASRSPFRPNMLGLSLVRLVSVDFSAQEGTVLTVAGADMADGTPVYDIKPYLPDTEAPERAFGGFVKDGEWAPLDVEDPDGLLSGLEEDERTLREILAQDPRPHYHSDPGRVYGFSYKGREIKFRVCGNTLILTDIIDKL